MRYLALLVSLVLLAVTFALAPAWADAGADLGGDGPTLMLTMPDAGAVAVGSTAVAAANLSPADPGFFGALLDAGKSRDYRAIAVLALVCVVWAARRVGPSVLKGDRGGAALALLVGVAGAFATSLAAGAPLGIGLVYDGLVMGLTAAGGWAVVRRLAAPKA